VMLFGRVNWFFEVSLASMAKGGRESKESLLYATKAGSSRAPNRWSKSRRWWYGVDEAVRCELMIGLAENGIEGSNRIRILRRGK
jgi:hypothetical protein